MNVGVIDAEHIAQNVHRFPNLVSMKLSAFHKKNGDNVTFLQDYNTIEDYDRVYISKVFTATPVPFWINEIVSKGNDKIKLGGTGFYFDKAEPLPYEVEHIMPDYKLYEGWVPHKYKYMYFHDYSIGFLTRRCFRGCPFCVNRNYKRVIDNAPLSEFFDESRKKICLWDDNILGFSGWRKKLDELIETKRTFVFRQGLDERLLTEEKAKILFSAKYDRCYTFAFDSIKDYDLIKTKLEIIKKFRNKLDVRFYVLVGFESIDIDDVKNAFIRIALLLRNGVIPYIMRYRSETSEPWQTSRYRGVYVALARWCNQVSSIKKLSFAEFCDFSDSQVKGISADHRALIQLAQDAPELKEYFDVRYCKP